MLAMVARSASVRLDRPSPKNSTNLPTTPLAAQHLRRRVRTRSVAVDALRAACRSILKPIDLGDQHGNRLAQHRGLGLDAPDAPAQNGEAVDHRLWLSAVRADQRVGHRRQILPVRLVFLAPDQSGREVFEIHLVADAGAGRHDAEVLERALRPSAGIHSVRGLRSNSRSTLVLNAIRRAEGESTMTEWSMTRSTAVDFGLILCPGRRRGRAHRVRASRPGRPRRERR